MKRMFNEAAIESQIAELSQCLYNQIKIHDIENAILINLNLPEQTNQASIGNNK